MNKIVLTTKLSIDDYLKVNYHMLYRKLIVKIMTGLGMLVLIITMLMRDSYSEFPWNYVLAGLILTAGFPVSIYFTAKRNYNSNARIKETITYEFDNDNIQLTGESFNSRLSWDKVYGVTETKDWILIWQNRQVANVVPKRDFAEGQLELFKQLVNSKPIRHELKKVNV